MEFFSQTGSTSCAPDECFIDRLGCSSPGKINRRNTVISRKKRHISELELLVLKLALQTFLRSQNFTSIHIQMDNIVSLTYLKKMGGTKNQKMTILSKEIWEISIPKQIMITVEYLPALSTKWRTLNLVAKWTHPNRSSADMSLAISAWN